MQPACKKQRKPDVTLTTMIKYIGDEFYAMRVVPLFHIFGSDNKGCPELCVCPEISNLESANITSTVNPSPSSPLSPNPL